jgi:hypothetical protein
MTAGRNIISENKDWGTPSKYVEAIRGFFGGVISLDPCSNHFSIVHARVEYMLPEKDGLRERWTFPTIYVNPPYGIDRERGTSIKDWLYKCAEASILFGSEVIALVPVATNTSHWKDYVFGKAAAICFLYDTRLRFLVCGKDEGKGAPMSCALIYWGGNVDRFYEYFLEFGAAVDIQRLVGMDIGRNGRRHRGQRKLIDIP